MNSHLSLKQKLIIIKQMEDLLKNLLQTDDVQIIVDIDLGELTDEDLSEEATA